MSKYSVGPLDFSALKTVPIADRGGKVSPAVFGSPYTKGAGIAALVDSLPKLLAADAFRDQQGCAA